MTSPTGSSLGVSGEPDVMRRSGNILADGAKNLDSLRNTQMASGTDVQSPLQGPFYGALYVAQLAAEVEWKLAVQQVIDLGNGMVRTATEIENQDEAAKGAVTSAVAGAGSSRPAWRRRSTTQPPSRHIRREGEIPWLSSRS